MPKSIKGQKRHIRRKLVALDYTWGEIKDMSLQALLDEWLSSDFLGAHHWRINQK